MIELTSMQYNNYVPNQIGHEIINALLEVTKTTRPEPHKLDRGTKINFFEIRKAVELLKLKFTSEEIGRLVQKYDESRDGTITCAQCKEIFTPVHKSAYLFQSFQASLQISKAEELPTTLFSVNQMLTPRNLHQALTSVGIVVTEMEAVALSYRSEVIRPYSKLKAAVGLGMPVPFKAFSQLTCPAVLFMSGIRSDPEGTAKRPLERFTPVTLSSWDQTGLSLHAVIGAFVGGVLSFVPKPSAATSTFTSSNTTTSSNNKKTILFIFQENKSRGDDIFDLLTMTMLVIWAGIN